MAATSATVRKVTAARGAGTTGRPTGMAAGWAAGTGRATAAAAIGRPTGRGPGTPGRATAGAYWRWGMVMSSSPDLARVERRLPHRLRDTHVLIQRVGGWMGQKRWKKRTGGPVRPGQNYTYVGRSTCGWASRRRPVATRSRIVDMSAASR